MKTFLLVVAGSLSMACFASAAGTIQSAVKGDLVVSEGKSLKPYDDSQLAPVKYYGIYYSASWCGPCRQFTPELVSWYKKTKRKHPNFELIFVSSDRSAEDMAAYMKEDKMEWPALDYSKKGSTPELTKYSGAGIPCLVLVDAEGKVLSHSYEGQNYVGPQKVLKDIDKTLRADSTPGSPTATGTSGGQKPGSGSFDDFFKKK